MMRTKIECLSDDALSMLTLIFVIGSSMLFSVAFAGVQLPVYRLQHYELLGILRGSKASSLNGEAISWPALSQLRTNGAGRVVLLQWNEILHLRDAVAKGVSGVVIVLPPGVNGAAQNEDLLDHMSLEPLLLEDIQTVAVYLVRDTPAIKDVLSRPATNVVGGSFNLNTILAGTAVQLSVQVPVPKQIQSPRFPTLWGKFVGFGLEEQLPTITIVAHYDSFGAAPSLASGADSNASGVAALLELMRIFSHLYGHSKTHPRANLVFVLSAAGKLNYFGIKKLLDDAVEGSNAESSIIADAQFSICIEAVSTQPRLFAHVSKPPKSDHPMGRFLELLNTTKAVAFGEQQRIGVSLVHKKINLAEEMRVWEHERFSLNKLPAFTLSAHPAHSAPKRYSIFDRTYDINALESNVRQIASALAATIYGKSREVTDEIFEGSLAVSKEHLKGVMDYLMSEPRSAVLHASRSSLSPLVATLKSMMSRFCASAGTPVQPVSQGSKAEYINVAYYEPDRREPEIVIYDQTEALLSINEVKPVMFDLVLLGCIVVYLGLVYGVLSNFGFIVAVLSPRPSHKKVD